MTTVVIGGAVVAGLMYLVGKGSEHKKIEREYTLGQIEQEVQQMKDRMFYQAF